MKNLHKGLRRLTGLFSVSGIIVFVLILQGIAASTCRAGGFSVLSIGVRRSGMMTVMSDADDPTAVFHNPACLADQEGTELYLYNKYVHVETTFRLRQENGELSEEVKPTLSDGLTPFIGISSDLGLERWHFGSALYLPNCYGAALPEDAVTRYHGHKALFLTGYYTLGASYELTGDISLGASCHFIYVYLNMERKYDLFQYNDPDQDYNIVIDADDSILSWSLGMRWQITDKMRFGIGFYPREDVEPEGDLDVEAPNGSTFIETDVTTSMLIPMSIRMGLSYWFTPRLQAAMDLNYWKYSDYKEQKVETGVDEFFGDFSSEKNYDDSYGIGLGLLFQRNARTQYLFGILRDWSPIPEEYYTLDSPNADAFLFSAGIQHDLGPRMQLGAAAVATIYDKVEVTDSKTSPPTDGKATAYAGELNLGLLYRF